MQELLKVGVLWYCWLTFAVRTLLLFFSPAWDAAKSTTLPALHLELKNMGKLESLASLGRNTWKYVLSVCGGDKIFEVFIE